MNDLDSDLTERLSALRNQGLYRELRRIDSAQCPRIQVGGRKILNFSSNDYLGLANDPALKEAALRAVETYGTGGGASRLICGSLSPHHELEQVVAEFKGTAAAISFSTGYAAALGTICALLGKDDIIVLDKLVHASIVDAARLSGAKMRVFAHNDLNELEDILKWGDTRQSTNAVSHAAIDTATPLESAVHRAHSASARRRDRILVVTESVFSMDGDQAPLTEIVRLKNRFGAWLMVDEAHATGVYGPTRRGLSEQLGLDTQIEIQMGTLGKALGAAGGYICGSRTLIDFLVNCARSFIFSTAPVPAAAAAATAGVRFVQSPAGEARRRALWRLVSELRDRLPKSATNKKTGGIAAESSTTAGSTSEAREGGPIIPLLVGDEAMAFQAASWLREQSILIPAIRYPTVARGRARLRLTISAAHTLAEIEQLVLAVRTLDRGYSISGS